MRKGYVAGCTCVQLGEGAMWVGRGGVGEGVVSVGREKERRAGATKEEKVEKETGGGGESNSDVRPVLSCPALSCPRQHCPS